MDIQNLYRQVIMDHYKNPQNKGLVNDANYLTIHMNNPSCGDDMTVQLKIEDKVITDVRHQGTGCSICCSSGSVMSVTLKGKTVKEALEIIHEFFEMVQAKPYNENILEGDAIVYQGVSQFPARIKCATLSWKAVEQGLNKKEE
ncbi:SUF system FeS cluster assembly protein [Alteracholeplasma palmae J233]|uniref:SUF system FeS cluster assembly protein n=1 Tax=Alteracholeplasma palmae (strain ATCC 49389 / J233) TaxID=1318466 RepID=U4KNN0_ALTPJ|nr:SUF system NifU family Fe-S cluster assembly protein [Alteracholeplasma palmae]CCV63805.1 SUF system FeS cluster assembly protein [Alteracholeplasma palmae J233]